MGQTSRGIVFPSNYSAVADVPADLQIMAQSIDNILQEDEQNIQNNSDDIATIQENVSAHEQSIQDNTTDINTLKNQVQSFSLVSETGNKVEIEINSLTYIMKIILKDKNNNVINTSNEIDLPLETMVVGARYDSTTKELVLTLKNGQETRFSIADLIDGLVSQSDFDDLAEIVETNTETIENNTSAIANNMKDIKQNEEDIDAITKLIDTEFDTNTAEGTTIDVEDSAEWDGSILIGGNTEQKQLSGKNKLDSSKIEQTTKNGITCSYDENTQEITFNGTCTANNTVFAFKGDQIPIIQNVTKLIAYYSSGSVSGSCDLRCFDSAYEKQVLTSLLQLQNNRIIAVTSSHEFIAANKSIRFNNGAVCDNFKFKVMISDDDNTDFEEYCGGQPSPNPNYQQEIKVVKGDNAIKHCGNNLLNPAFLVIGKIISLADGKLINSPDWASFSNFIPVKYGESVVMSRIETSWTHFIFAEYDENYQKLERINKNIAEGTNTAVYTIINEKTKYIRVGYRNDLGHTNIQLEKDDKATPYDPYKEEEYKLDLWKENEFDINSTAYSTGRYVDANGNLVGNGEFSVYKNTIKSNTLYKFTNSGKSSIPGVAIFDINDNFVEGFTYSAKSILTHKMPSNASYILYSVATSPSSARYDADIYQIQESIELCKIKDNNGNLIAQDKIIHKNGEFQVERNVTKFINNGSGLLNFKLVTSYIADDLLACVFQLHHKVLGSAIAILCDKMSGKYLKPDGNRSDSNNVRNVEGIALHSENNNQVVCSVKKSRLNEESIEGMAQFFTENPLTIYVPALETTYETITDQTLISQLEKLLKVQTYHGVNHFYVETDNLEPVMELTYKQSNKIKNEKQNARLDNIESRLALLE